MNQTFSVFSLSFLHDIRSGDTRDDKEWNNRIYWSSLQRAKFCRVEACGNNTPVLDIRSTSTYWYIPTSWFSSYRSRRKQNLQKWLKDDSMEMTLWLASHWIYISYLSFTGWALWQGHYGAVSDRDHIWLEVRRLMKEKILLTTIGICWIYGCINTFRITSEL